MQILQTKRDIKTFILFSLIPAEILGSRGLSGFQETDSFHFYITFFCSTFKPLKLPVQHQAVMSMHCCGTAFLVQFLSTHFSSLYTELSAALLQFQKQYDFFKMFALSLSGTFYSARS